MRIQDQEEKKREKAEAEAEAEAEAAAAAAAAMKSIVLTSSSTRSAFFGDRSDTTRDSCYFPGCRKDMNCNCEICQASINATLDLMPSAQQSSLTKLSASRLTPERTPISFDPSTPESFARRNLTPALHSTAKSRPSEEKKRRSRVGGFCFWRFLVRVSLIYATLDLGFQWVVSEFLGPAESPQVLQRIGEESGMLGDLNERLGFVQRKLEEELIHGKVMNCSAVDSIWEVNQDGFLIHSRCVLYKSSAAEVSVWGWPLQTAGLLVTGFSSRSFTILSGRVTEWSSGKIGFSIRNANSSWIHGKWSTSALQLDRNTWILEYRQSTVLQNSRPIAAALELLKFRVSRVVQGLKQEFWLTSFPSQHYKDPKGEDTFKYPT